MSGCLLDVNVWVAAAFERHPAHRTAQEFLLTSIRTTPVLFCRATQHSFLRLVSTPTISRAYGIETLGNRDALAALAAFQSLQQVEWIDEPLDLESLWWSLAGLDEAAPKRWMDAYLAAFAIRTSSQLVTLDRDFSSFLDAGLDLRLLRADVV